MAARMPPTPPPTTRTLSEESATSYQPPAASRQLVAAGFSLRVPSLQFPVPSRPHDSPILNTLIPSSPPASAAEGPRNAAEGREGRRGEGPIGVAPTRTHTPPGRLWRPPPRSG